MGKRKNKKRKKIYIYIFVSANSLLNTFVKSLAMVLMVNETLGWYQIELKSQIIYLKSNIVFSFQDGVAEAEALEKKTIQKNLTFQ